MPARHAAAPRPRPGDLLVRVGALVFAVGVLAVLAILVPFLTGASRNASAPLDLLALLLPLGLGLALLGLLRSARSSRFRRPGGGTGPGGQLRSRRAAP